MLLVLSLTGCAISPVPVPPPNRAPAMTSGTFIMNDGAKLPYREWLPNTPIEAVVLALHGFNDSRDAWAIPAPFFTEAGIAIIAPDQRGFGDAPDRGRWVGTNVLVDDARQMALLVHARFPGIRLVLMGESMGAAELILLATSPNPPPVEGYVFSAPALWGRQDMNVFLRSLLWLASHSLPWLKMSGSVVRVRASDNNEALFELFEDPLTLRSARMDTLWGLVNLMSTALAAGGHFHGCGLFLYGGHDELVPKRAMRQFWHELEEANPDIAADKGCLKLGFYKHGYHLLLRDKNRILPIEDIVHWIEDPRRPLLSGADRAALSWLNQKQ